MNQLQIELRERKISQKAIALELGVSEMSVSLIVRNKGVSRRIMNAVAKKLGKPTRKVFPDYFRPDPVEEKEAA